MIIAVEKNNDDARKHYNSSNRLDGGQEIVVADARLELLQHCGRKKRKYEKSNEEYWRKGIFDKRRRHDSSSDDDDTMS